ncbi:MAG: (d)CMP kinase [Bacteroidota bacterium]|jgi:cytidylate kinase
MSKIVIAIDGYSACGKSTMARQLAKMLGYVYIDSGAMYRAITLYFIRNNVDLTSAEDVDDALKNIQLSFTNNPETGQSDIHLNGENVESQVRALEVAEKVSLVAAIPEVRTFAVSEQRRLGSHKGIVMDGRDIGTTVFPEAELKFFVTADPDVRARRRLLELSQSGTIVELEEVKKNLIDRDALDSTRATSPLKKAEDAIEIDTTSLTREEQLQKILDSYKQTVETIH